ncbi:MAG: MltA domain-containing protein [Candidatus Binatia bacterium]
MRWWKTLKNGMNDSARLTTQKQHWLTRHGWFVMGLLLLLSSQPAVSVALEQDNPEFVPFFADDLDRSSLKIAARQSLAALRWRDDDEVLAFGTRRISVRRIRESLETFLTVLDTERDVGTALLRHFDIYRVSSPVLITGYHEPVIKGSLVPTKQYRYPLYRVPGNLRTDFSRVDIDGRGALQGKGYEFVWLADPVDRFFLHIQGSGQIQLPGGMRMRVGYAGDNGKAYHSIGRMLLDQGRLSRSDASTLGIRRYLAAHPEERDTILFTNPRYIFFKPLAIDSAGPVGSLGVPLTPGRSLAADPSVYPLGGIAFIHAKRPERTTRNEVQWREFFRFVLLQDTGAAIRGPSRADLFWGSAAEGEAGAMAQRGEMYLLVKKQ